MARRTSLRIESLESRTVPALFGIPWADPRHLTLSFVPDGTDVDGVGSNLSTALPGKWQTEVLRAVETWAANANLNVAVVADSGDPLGAPGAAQGDSHFGDIRIAARPLSDNVLAITTPPGYLGGTRVGDIVLNSHYRFRVNGNDNRTDLYSVLLQEIGHALGVGNSADPNSVMYEAYSGVRTGLSAGDVAALQALYGARAPDALEGPGGNETLATAREITRPTGANSSATLLIQGDLTTQRDVDFYKVQTLASNPNGLTVKLDAGVSLLAARLTVYDADGKVVGSAQSKKSQTGVLSVSLSHVPDNAYYFIKVESANASFGVGGYQLKVVSNPNAAAVVTAGAVTLDDAYTNDTIASATPLATTAGYAANTHYNVQATLRDGDVDFYKVHAPRVSANQQNVLTVNVRALDPGGLVPVAQVYNAARQPVDATILANGDGTYTVQVPGAASDQDYYVSVTADDGRGNYQLDLDFRSQVINLQTFAGGPLDAAAPQDFRTLTTNRSQMMYFVLSADSPDAAATAGVRMTILNRRGYVVASLVAPAGQTVSLTTYLAQGTYTVRFEGLTADRGEALPKLTYSLKGVTLTDPIGPTGSDPTLGGKGTVTNDYVWTKFLLDYYTNLVLDPITDVLR